MAFEKAHTLIGKLRAKRPDYLLVTVEDNEERVRVNVVEHPKRTQRAMQTLNELAWTKIEMYDKKGGLVGTHMRSAEDEPPPNELETLGEVGARAGRAAELAAVVNQVLRAQDSVLNTVSRMFGPLLDSFTKQNEAIARRLDAAQRDSDRTHKENLDLQTELLKQAARVAATRLGGGGDDAPGSMSEEAIAAALPDILKHVFGGKGDEAPANGANGTNGAKRPNPAGEPPRRGRQQDKAS